MSFRAGAIALALLASAASAESIVFESDSDILIVRMRELAGATRVDVLGSRDGSILCVAIGADGRPIATARGFVESGQVTFSDLRPSAVARVACRYN